MSNEGVTLSLYSYWRSSCSWRVRCALLFKGLSFEIIPVNLLKKEQCSSEHYVRNPMQLIPCLTATFPESFRIASLCGKTVTISESIAIMEFLDEVWPDAHRLLPVDPLGRARVRQLALFIASDTQPVQNLRVINHVEQLVLGACQKCGDCADEAKCKSQAAEAKQNFGPKFAVLFSLLASHLHFDSLRSYFEWIISARECCFY